MLDNGSFRVAIVRDRMQPTAMLLAGLTPAEREYADLFPTDGRRRHFALGRLAAHLAIQRVLGDKARSLVIQVLSGQEGQPLTCVNEEHDLISVSVSHSGCLGVACAWLNSRSEDYFIGVDLERQRPTEVAQSQYAFSRRERNLLSHTLEDPTLAGLAAWTVKEAVWKALRADRRTGPEAIKINALSLAVGHATVRVNHRLRCKLGKSLLRVQVRTLDGPDGAYILSIAEVASRKSLWRLPCMPAIECITDEVRI